MLLCRQSSHHWSWRCQQWAGRTGEDPSWGLPGAAVHGPHLLGATRGGQSEAGARDPFEVSEAMCGLKLKLKWYDSNQGDPIVLYLLFMQKGFEGYTLNTGGNYSVPPLQGQCQGIQG